MAEKLTDKAVRDLTSPSPVTRNEKVVPSNRITYDTEVKGFGVRVTSAGAKAFILNYRAGDTDRRLTIGSSPDWTVAAARDKAKALKRRVDDGHDPMQERHERRTAPTVADLADLYRETHLPRKRASSRMNDELILAKHIIPRLGKLRVAEVRRPEIAAMHRDMTKSTPIAANRCLALLSKMFSVAMAEEWRADNPSKGIERNPENRRSRYLSPTEITKLGGTLASHPEKVSCNAIRLLLLTGARKGETLSARWDQFDLSAGVWTKPGAATKQAKEHRVPLSAPALVLLTEMQAKADAGCHYLFPGQPVRDAKGKSTVRPLTSIKRVWLAVCRKAELAEQVEHTDKAGKVVKDKDGKPLMVWQPTARIHDLRHTYASILASAGLSLPIIGALLGHTQPSTTQRYSHLMDDPLRAATERVGAIVTGGGKGADVVPMRREA